MGLLDTGVKEFLERRLGGECIDKLPMTEEQQEALKADFFLFEREVVVEVKELVDDRVERARAVIDKWRARPGWPLVYGEAGIQEVLKHHPLGRHVSEELFAAVTASIENAFRDANRQIRETKKAFGLQDSHGILMLVNEAVDLFEPKVLAGKLSRLFLKKEQDGKPRFPHVDTVLIVTGAHSVRGADGRARSIIIAMTPQLHEPNNPLDSLEHLIMEQWAAFLNRPLEHGGVLTTPEDLKALRVEGKKPPLVL
jgi:hypothetical protein